MSLCRRADTRTQQRLIRHQRVESTASLLANVGEQQGSNVRKGGPVADDIPLTDPARIPHNDPARDSRRTANTEIRSDRRDPVRADARDRYRHDVVGWRSW